MASTPVNPGAPPQGGGAPQGQGGGAPQGGAGGDQQPQPLQILAAITRLAQMLAQSSSSTSPEAEAIIKSVQDAARKLMPAQPDQQQQQSPF